MPRLLVVLSLCAVSVSSEFATRYWDCCKAHCSWDSNSGGLTSPALASCNMANVKQSDPMTTSACTNAAPESAYTCYSNIPFEVNATHAFGFAAVPARGDICGKCHKLTFTGTGKYGASDGVAALQGKVMVVMATNIGHDVSGEQFDIMIPGGGVGAFDACTAQWKNSDLGAQYGGFLTQCQDQMGFNQPLSAYKTCVTNKCNSVFADAAFDTMRAGCLFFSGWYEAADNPELVSEIIDCPQQLIDISGLTRGPAPPTPPSPQPTSYPTAEGGGGCPVSGQCDCAWASEATCGTDDGSSCNTVCCCPFRTTQPDPCTDGQQGADELGVDCGGPCPNKCYCEVHSCGAHGTCVESTTSCDCVDGYTGNFCETPPVDKCADNKCGEFGDCNQSTGACTCTMDYSGDLCETPPPPRCDDGIKNQDEINVDCGGPNCADCEGYQWLPSDWTTCSVPCDGGVRTRTVQCQGPDGTIQPDNANCDEFLHPAQTSETCNLEPCPTYSWRAGDWENCTKPCGSGVRIRTTTCISSQGDVAVAPSKCDPATIPSDSEECNVDACTVAYWVTGDWSACDVECGGGQRSRSVVCMDPVSPPAPAANEADCQGDKPPSDQACSVVACKSYSWMSCAWDNCTAACGSSDGMQSTRQRTVYCVDDTQQVVDRSLCDSDQSLTRPLDHSVCTLPACTTFSWMSNGWGACNPNTLVRERTFHCHAADGTAASDSDCAAAAGPLPHESEVCALNACMAAVVPVHNSDAPTQEGLVPSPEPSTTTVASSARESFGVKVFALLLISFSLLLL